MNRQETKCISLDELSLKGSYWPSSKESLANVLIVHGLGEHHRRYEHVALAFTEQGFNVYAFDQRGHGISDGKRGHSPSQQHLHDDLEKNIKQITEISDKPLFIYGHSFGGNVVTSYMLKNGTANIKGAIISAPWFRLAFEPPKIEVALGRMMNHIWPAFTQSNQLDPGDLTNDAAVNDAYKNDPLVHDKISAALFVNAYAAGYWCIDNASKLKISSLLIHGQDDPLIDVNGSEDFIKNAGDNVSIKVWSDTKHEPHNDLKKEEVISYISSWISSNL
jgi:alpha-beta hydrolase superfamily lysophospholipase